MKTMAGLSLLACLFILVAAFPAGAFDDDAYMNHLSEVFNRFDEKLRDYLVTELRAFIETYPASTRSSEAHLLLARTLREQGDKHGALAVYTRGILLYPESAWRPALGEEANVILQNDKDDQPTRNILLGLLNPVSIDSTTAGRHHAYMDFLSRLPSQRHHDRLLAESALFTRLYPGDGRIEIMQLWSSLSYANIGRHREAVVSLEKLESLTPDSPLIPLSRFYRADILTRDLDNHTGAHGILNNIVEQYPECENMPDVLNLRAEVRLEKIKDPPGAILDYLTLAREYGNHPKAADGMMNAANITRDKINDYRGAIDRFNEFAERFPTDPRAPGAMQEAAKLYLEKLKQYTTAAEQCAKAAEAYPDPDFAVEMLMRAAKIHEDKTKNYDQANTYYRIIETTYQEHEKLKDIQKKIQQNIEKSSGKG
jgi:TolA-binding protein